MTPYATKNSRISLIFVFLAWSLQAQTCASRDVSTNHKTPGNHTIDDEEQRRSQPLYSLEQRSNERHVDQHEEKQHSKYQQEDLGKHARHKARQVNQKEISLMQSNKISHATSSQYIGPYREEFRHNIQHGVYHWTEQTDGTSSGIQNEKQTVMKDLSTPQSNTIQLHHIVGGFPRILPRGVTSQRPINSRQARNSEWDHHSMPITSDDARRSHIIFRHKSSPVFTDLHQDPLQNMHASMPDTLFNGHTVDESSYVYLPAPKQQASAIYNDQTHTSLARQDMNWMSHRYDDKPKVTYTNYHSSDQVRIESMRPTEMKSHAGEYNTHGLHSSKSSSNSTQLSRGVNDGVYSSLNDDTHQFYTNTYSAPSHGTISTHLSGQVIQERSDEVLPPVYNNHPTNYNNELPPGLTNNHPALMQLLSTTGADKLMAELRSLRKYQVKDDTKQEKAKNEECDCGAPASTGTVMGLTGLAALLIYALSIQTITSSSSATGRSLMPDSHGYMESFLPTLSAGIVETRQIRPDQFSGVSWEQYSQWKTLPVVSTPTPVTPLRSRPPMSSSFKTGWRRSDKMRGRRGSGRQQPNTSTSLVERVQRWIQGRGRRVYRPANGTVLSGDKSEHCQCGLQQMLDMLSYVPLAVLLGYSTTISTTALTTGSNAAGSATGGATNIGVTINDADVITNDNTNSPTLTNTDSDVLSVVAQGSPVNTNTNTASNQDSDMISNSIIGGRRRRHARNVNVARKNMSNNERYLMHKRRAKKFTATFTPQNILDYIN